MQKHNYLDEAVRAARELNIDLNSTPYNVNDLANGIKVEYEHGRMYPGTNVTDDALIPTAKIALAHLNELKPDGKTQYDYYDGLEVMEESPSGYWRNVDAKAYWKYKQLGWYVIIVVLLAGVCLFVCKLGYSNESGHCLLEKILAGVVVIGMGYIVRIWK